MSPRVYPSYHEMCPGIEEYKTKSSYGNSYLKKEERVRWQREKEDISDRGGISKQRGRG